jgi:hypothetical protein
MNAYQKEVARNQRMRGDLNKRMGNLPQQMRPRNIGEINSVMWPFWFTFSAPEVAPMSSLSGFFSVTQEAGFNMMSLCKVVFRKSGVGPNFVYTAIDAEQPDCALSNANGLTVTLRDAQSSRVFMSQPLPIDMIGPAEWPFVLPSPQFLLPNATMEIVYQNSNATDTFVPFVTVFGYRVRIEDANKILSTITE